MGLAIATAEKRARITTENFMVEDLIEVRLAFEFRWSRKRDGT